MLADGEYFASCVELSGPKNWLPSSEFGCGSWKGTFGTAWINEEDCPRRCGRPGFDDSNTDLATYDGCPEFLVHSFRQQSHTR